MSVDVATETIIQRPRSEVAAFATDPDNAPKWYVNIKSVRWQSEPPLGVGSVITFEAEFLRRRLAYTYRITELEPNVRLVMRTAEGPFPMETTYTWEDLPGGHTRMALRNRGEPSGFGRLAAPLMGISIRRANQKDLRLLKTLLER